MTSTKPLEESPSEQGLSTSVAGFLERSKWPLVVSVVGALVLYLLAMFASDHEQVREGFSRLDVVTWGLVLSFPLGNYLLRFIRWHWYLSSLGNSVPVGRGARIYLAGFALTTTPGKVGETIRSVFLHSEGVPYPDSMAAFVAERYTDLVAVAVLAVLASLRFEGYGWFVALSLFILGFSLWLLRSPAPERWLAKGRKSRGFLERALSGGLGTLRACRVLLSSRLLFGGLLLGGLGWALEGVAFWVVLGSLGLPVNLPTAIGIYSISTLAGALSFVPGGLGAMEGVMSVFLVFLGSSLADAVAVTVLIRIATLWFAVGLGLLAMVTLAKKRKLSDSPSGVIS